MNAIADASSLIVLARQNALWLLQRVYPVVALVPEVETEAVLQGRAKGYVDAERIAAAVASGQLAVVTPTAAERELATQIGRSAPSLSNADRLTLACARARRLTLIMEELRGRRVAAAHGITYVTVQVLPLHGFLGQRLSSVECDDLLVRLGRAMHSDEAVVAVLTAAASEIARLRSMPREDTL